MPLPVGSAADYIGANAGLDAAGAAASDTGLGSLLGLANPYLALGTGALDLVGLLGGPNLDPMSLIMGAFQGRPTMQATQDVAKYANSANPVLAMLGRGAQALANAGIPLSSPQAGKIFGPYFQAASQLENQIRWGQGADPHARQLTAQTLANALHDMGNPNDSTGTLTGMNQAWGKFQKSGGQLGGQTGAGSGSGTGTGGGGGTPPAAAQPPTIQQLLASGQTPHSLLEQGYTLAQLEQGGVPISGFGPKAITDLNQQGMVPHQMLEQGFTQQQLQGAGIGPGQLGPRAITDLNQQGITPHQMLEQGFTQQQLAGAGIGPQQLGTNAIRDLLGQGQTPAQLAQQGFTGQQIVQAAGPQGVGPNAITDLLQHQTIGSLEKLGITPAQIAQASADQMARLYGQPGGSGWGGIQPMQAQPPTIDQQIQQLQTQTGSLQDKIQKVQNEKGGRNQKGGGNNILILERLREQQQKVQQQLQQLQSQRGPNQQPPPVNPPPGQPPPGQPPPGQPPSQQPPPGSTTGVNPQQVQQILKQVGRGGLGGLMGGLIGGGIPDIGAPLATPYATMPSMGNPSSGIGSMLLGNAMSGGNSGTSSGFSSLGQGLSPGGIGGVPNIAGGFPTMGGGALGGALGGLGQWIAQLLGGSGSNIGQGQGQVFQQI